MRIKTDVLSVKKRLYAQGSTSEDLKRSQLRLSPLLYDIEILAIYLEVLYHSSSKETTIIIMGLN